jgi:hypothetical protein
MVSPRAGFLTFPRASYGGSGRERCGATSETMKLSPSARAYRAFGAGHEAHGKWKRNEIDTFSTLYECPCGARHRREMELEMPFESVLTPEERKALAVSSFLNERPRFRKA